MADNEKGEETAPRGNEWEVVSLTASTYAASPGPQQVELNDNENGSSDVENKGETSQAMFMSGHFVVPPSQHENSPLEHENKLENLPLEPENIEIHNEQGGKDIVPELVAESGGRSDSKDDENWNIKALTVADDFNEIQFLEEKGDKLSISATDLEEGTNFQGLNLVDKEQSIYSTVEFGSFNSEATMGGSTTTEEKRGTPEPTEYSDRGLDLDSSDMAKLVDEDKYDGSELPCEAWWKRQAASVYAHAKEANAYWSIFIAAAVMGLVILGQQWQQERWQVLQLKWQFGINDQRMGRMMDPLARFKDVIAGGTRRGAFIKGSASTER